MRQVSRHASEQAEEEAGELWSKGGRSSPWHEGLWLYDIGPAAVHTQLHRARQPGGRCWSARWRLPSRRQWSQCQQGTTRRRGAADWKLQGYPTAADRRKLLLRLLGRGGLSHRKIQAQVCTQATNC